jgi:hypothetical protein
MSSEATRCGAVMIIDVRPPGVRQIGAINVPLAQLEII